MKKYELIHRLLPETMPIFLFLLIFGLSKIEDEPLNNSLHQPIFGCNRLIIGIWLIKGISCCKY
jgi:hypothetical protein